MQGNVWMSPDETANAISAISLVKNGNFGYDWHMPSEFAWAHPRSYVLVPELNRMAPVGFLGVPLILAACFALFGLFGILFFTPLLALATLWPLWKILPETWVKPVKFMTLFVWMSFPAVILYANRGTFAQLPVVCLAVWIWWLITKCKIQNSKFKIWRLLVAGGVSGLALCMRPTEALWLIPMVVAAWLYGRASDEKAAQKSTWQQVVWFCAPLILVLFIGAYFGYMTYGSWLVSGYQIRPVAQQAAANVTEVLHTQSLSVFSALPFGLHPRNIIWNVQMYLGWLLWPWTFLLLAGGILLVKEKFWKNPSVYPVIAMAWTIVVVVFFYGNGIYQDHVQINAVTIGNSFIRYILPISIPMALAAGCVFSSLWRHWPLKIFAVCLTVAMVSGGIWLASSHDDEGLLSNERELIRYQQFRNAAVRLHQHGSFVLSDRSDKVFYPSLMAVSPMPSADQLLALRETGVDVSLFLPTQDWRGMKAWLDKGVLLFPVFTEGNQTLYDVR